MNKLAFRIIGALAASLIIISVFVPFISAYGYFQSLWEINEAVGTLYIPITIIVLGGLGVFLFALNKKTEFIYISFGALLFYLIIETIPIIKQGSFNTLGMGYYFILIGNILIGIMTFICNLKKRKKVKQIEKNTDEKDVSILDKIDMLYGNDNTENNNFSINQIESLQVNTPVSEPKEPSINLIKNTNVENSINEIPISNNIPLQNSINEIPNDITNNNVNAQTNLATAEFVMPGIVVNKEIVNANTAESQQINPIPLTDIYTTTNDSSFTQDNNMQPVNPVVSQFTPLMQQSNLGSQINNMTDEGQNINNLDIFK